MPLGLGKWITSVTMTVFYVLLYYVWRRRYQIVGKRGLAEQKVEIKRRSTGARRDIPLAALTDALAFSQRNAKVWGSELSLFGGLFE